MEQFVHVGKFLGLGLQVLLAAVLVVSLKKRKKDLRLTLGMRFVLHGLLAAAVGGALQTALGLGVVPSMLIGRSACIIYAGLAIVGVAWVWLETMGHGFLLEASFPTIALAIFVVVSHQQAPRSEVAVYRDLNGCEYLFKTSGNSSLTPRLDPQGRQVCKEVK